MDLPSSNIAAFGSAPPLGATISSTDPAIRPEENAPQPVQPATALPRSCITCRRRKVRCNKQHPCSNCIKARIDCVFPGPGRAPRKSKKPADKELLSRLKRLEGVVQSLGVQVDDEEDPGSENTQSSRTSDSKEKQDASTNNYPRKNAHFHPGFMNTDPRKPVQRDISQELGRLVIGEGRSRYVSNRFWTNFGDEIEEMRDILEATSDEDDYPPPENNGSTSMHSQPHEGFLFAFQSLAHTLRGFHPNPGQVLILWKTYHENVAPLITIFHLPTLGKLICEGSSDLNSLNKNTEAVLFSVYYAAVTSMNSVQCYALLGEHQDILLTRYRFSMEQAMARANLLTSQSIVLLQAIVLFLTCVRRQDDSRYVWSMVAVVLRIAQGIGIHRDGSAFALSPFETEMRRRLFWHIALLDYRAAEDHGCDPFIHEAFYDTRIPLNINDADISPETKEPPSERVECTDLTFTLIRCEVAVTARRLSYISPNPACPKASFTLSLEEREKHVEDLNKRLEERYVQHCEMTTPIFWVCATLSRLTVSRLWLTIHQPMGRDLDGLNILHDKRNRLFLTSIEVIEFSHLLETNENTMKWSWLFHTYMQWHSVAFTLAELCVRPPCPVVDRAWRAVESVCKSWDTKPVEKKGMVWRAIQKLLARAKAFRQVQLQELEHQFGLREEGPSNDVTSFSTTTSTHKQPMPVSDDISPDQQQALEIIGSLHEYPTDVDMIAHGMVSNVGEFQTPNSQTEPSSNLSQLDLVMHPAVSDTNAQQTMVAPSSWLQYGAKDNGNASTVSEAELLPTQAPPPWDTWDEVVREFQMDVAEGAEVNNAHLQSWFE
ncbi:hypothetical protein FQN51_007411 [Onygenales sp. PD_10]|nr:hypothetical protein FQN51_007411 [Onygenales sp. PD_10]